MEYLQHWMFVVWMHEKNVEILNDVRLLWLDCLRRLNVVINLAGDVFFPSDVYDGDDDYDYDDNDVKNDLKSMIYDAYLMISMHLCIPMNHGILLMKHYRYYIMVRNDFLVNVLNLLSIDRLWAVELCRNVDGNPTEIEVFQLIYPK